MDRLRLRTRVTRRGDELVIAIPDHLAPLHIREGDEVSVPLPRTRRPQPWARDPQEAPAARHL